MYKPRDNVVAPKLCRHKKDNFESKPNSKEEQTAKMNGYDQVRNQVMESDAQAWHNVNQTISNLKKPLPKRK